jgi:signal transduction histidine kinase
VPRLGSIYARVRDPHPVVVDVLLALGFAVIGVVTEFAPSEVEGRHDPNGLSVLLALAGTLPLIWRRSRPAAVFAVIAAAATVHALMLFPGGGPFFGLLLALYALAAYGSPVAARLGLGCLLVIQPLIIARDPDVNGVAQVLVGAGFMVAAWVFGDSRRVRRLHLETVEDRAARLERERDEQARIAVREERTRIAREMHDIVAHNVSVMVVQAGAARRMIARDPGAATEAVSQVEATGRAALDEMRRALGVLRREPGDEAAGAGAADPPVLAPQPDLGDVPALVATCREAGLDVRLRTDGERRPVPSGVGLTAYRIVQEALTNTMKHAGPARAEVALAYDDDLTVIVTDDGRGAATDPHTGGHGIAGMRERVEVFGGELSAGPRRGGGFRVQARLPIEPRPARSRVSA